MRVVVIGGTGHVGTFLVPCLVRAGHEVISISRGTRAPYADAPQWQQVQQITADRRTQEAEGTFGATVLAANPDVVVDLICFTVESAASLVDALRGHVDHLLHCGSTWRHGASRKLPIAEDSDSAAEPVDEYGIQKARITRMLKEETARGGVVTTSLHPGHIVGPGWQPIGPLGNLDRSIWSSLSAGRTISIPGTGTEMLHHVHADDVAQAFELAIADRAASAGEDFNIVAPTALSVRGYIEIASGWFAQTPHTESVSWDRFRELSTDEHADVSWSHLDRSQVFSIRKAQTVLGYAPRYQPEEAILESIRWLIENGRLEVERPLTAPRSR